MNRYLFKAKRKDNGEWVYGFPIIYASGNIKITIPQCRKDLQETSKLVYGTYEIIPETLCQCTGLQDRDGKDMFENDIIDINQTVNGCNLFKIVWDKYKWNAEYYVKMVTPRLYEYNFEELLDINVNDFEKDIKIIGNKFDKEED